MEVGWDEYVPANQTNKVWRIYWHDELGGGGDLAGPLISDPSPTYWSNFWLNIKQNTTDVWRMHVDIDLDGVSDWDHDATSRFSSGYAFAETARRGRTDTGARDWHKDMLYMTSQRTWNGWFNWEHWCWPYGPDISNWVTSFVDFDEYKTIAGDQICT